MKGTLNKHEEGWLVRYGDMQFLPLHPDFIEMMDTCFTSKFTQVVEFEMVLCSHSKSKDDYYAKLINHSVDTNEMINHIGDANDMVEDDVEKLAKELWKKSDDTTGNPPYIYSLGVEHCYNKAKETLYTEEQVREVIRNCFKSNSLGFLITEDDMMRTIKQPKKD
jgi:hypothetical protein